MDQFTIKTNTWLNSQHNQNKVVKLLHRHKDQLLRQAINLVKFCNVAHYQATVSVQFNQENILFNIVFYVVHNI